MTYIVRIQNTEPIQNTEIYAGLIRKYGKIPRRANFSSPDDFDDWVIETYNCKIYYGGLGLRDVYVEYVFENLSDLVFFKLDNMK